MEKIGPKNFYDLLLDFVEITIIGTTIFLLVYLFIGQLLEVTGESMIPTLADKEQVIAEKLSMKINPLETGEIVVFRHPEQHTRLLIKRIIGLPDEKLKIMDGQVYINGTLLEEPYLKNGIITKPAEHMSEGVEYKIPGNSYILMGDNRGKSSDSRHLGAIREELIVGKALLVYYPLNNFRLIEH